MATSISRAKLIVETAEAERNLDRVGKSVDDVGSAFKELQRIVAGVAIGQFITNSLNLAARLDTLGQVTGIATANLRGFQQAVSQAGGNSDKAVDAISDLVKNIGEAANGSGELVSSFSQVGVSINDLRTLSEQDILKKTIDGLARIPDQANRSAISMKLMGEAVKTVDFRSVSASYGTFSAQSTQFASSAAAAREAQDKMALAVDKLRESVVNALEPINRFIASIDPRTIKAVVDTIVNLGIAFASLYAASRVLSVLGQITNSMSKAGTAAGQLSKAIGLSGVFTEASKGARGLKIEYLELANIFNRSGKGAEASAGALKKLASTFGGVLVAFTRFIPLIGVAIAAFQILDAVVERFTGSNLYEWAERAAKAMGLISQTAKEIESENAAEMKRLQARSEAAAKQNEEFKRGQEAAARLKNELAKQAGAYGLINAEHSRYTDKLRASMGFQVGIIGLTEDQVELETKLREEAERYQDIVQGIQDKQKQLRTSLIGEKDPEKAALVNAEVAKLSGTLKIVSDQHLKNREIIERQTTALQAARKAEENRLFVREQIIKSLQAEAAQQQNLNDTMRGINQKMGDIKFGVSLTGQSPLKKQIAQINEDARKAAQEAGNAFAATFEDKGFLTPEEAQALTDGLDQIAQGYKSIADEQIKGLGASKEYLAGFPAITDPILKGFAAWKEEFKIGTKDAFTKFKDDAMDAGKQAANSFNNFTSGMEDAFVEFAKTGKLSFKSLADSIIADLIRIAVRKAIVAAIGGPLGSLFGFANGGPVQGATPIIVGERGPELFVPTSAGKIISNSSLKGSGQNSSNMSGGQTVVNYNIQAVDASSFRSLVAKDPSFIYAVTEQGRRSQPTRSR